MVRAAGDRCCDDRDTSRPAASFVQAGRNPTRFMPIHEYELLLRLLATIALGGAIGFERERHEQPAGLRTHMLVALASATFMMVSEYFVFFQHYTKDGIINVDVSRIAARTSSWASGSWAAA